MVDTAKIQVTRKTREIDELDADKKPTGKKIVDPSSLVTAFSYVDPEMPASTTTFVADANKTEFSMTPEQAVAAVETGGFVVAESSKSSAEDEVLKDIRPGETFSVGPAIKE